MPAPAEIHFSDGQLQVAGAFAVAIEGESDARLHEGVTRLLQRWDKRTGLKFALVKTVPANAKLVIKCEKIGDVIPRLGDDESYTLDITSKQVVLHAGTIIGGLRGLETLVQLLQQEPDKFFLPAMSIRDRPRYPWRGLMIDVARRWQPVEVIERNLDGMALVKLNVLHLHLTDDQGFRVESRTHPELNERGSDGHFFTQAQIREIVAYAQARGIRVVPEFDLPAHVTSWLVSHPELASAPGPYAIERKWGEFTAVLDPTNEKVYALLDDFLGEMAALFPDDYIHIGGDGNNDGEWNANPRIQAYIKAHDLKNNEGLRTYFDRRVSEILRRHGKRVAGWDGIVQADLPADSVIQSRRAPTLASAVTRGFFGILSNGYSIDFGHAAAEYYANDPLPAGSTLSLEQERRILGGEATMWSEWVTPDNIDTRIWPRTAAIAERLWSPREIKDVPDMYRRIGVVDQRLEECGLQNHHWPLFALPGVDAQSPTADALRSLAAIVEPAKDNRRAELQPDANQLTPLDDLADWARPDSAVARVFNSAVRLWLFAPGELNPQRTLALSAQLESWRAAGELAAKAPAASTPVAQARVRTARALASISQVGMDAIESLANNRPLAPAQLASASATLEAAAQPTAAAVEFPILPTLRLLVAAASEPGRRAELSRDAWRRQLEEIEAQFVKRASKS